MSADAPRGSPAAPAARPPVRARRWLVLALSSVAALVLAELVFRVRAHFENAATLERALSQPVQLMKNGEAPLAGVIRLSPDDRITYELKPNLANVRFKGRPLSTDSRGFRSPEFPDQGGPNAVTIVGLGDSMMFGLVVGDGETYLDELRRQLVQHHPELDWRVVNTGVPGYNTVMEAATLETKCLRFHPDLVILGVDSNDYEPPNYVREADDVFDLSRSFLVEFVDSRLRTPAERRGVSVEGLVHRGLWEEQHGPGVPRRYDDLYGPLPFARAVDQLLALTRDNGIELLALATTDHNLAPELMAAIEARGIASLRLQWLVEREVTAATGRPFSWEDYAQSDLVIAPDDWHPSVKQHALIGQELYKALVAAGHVARWSERARAATTPR